MKSIKIIVSSVFTTTEQNPDYIDTSTVHCEQKFNRNTHPNYYSKSDNTNSGHWKNSSEHPN